MPSLKFAIRKPFKLLAVAVIYALAYRLVGDYLVLHSQHLFFIATGIALAVLLLGGKLYALSVFFGGLIANLWGGFDFWVAIGIATGYTLSAMLGAAFLTYKHNFDFSLLSLPHYFKLGVLGGLFSSSIGALIGATTLQLAHIIPPDRYFNELLYWIMDGTLGVVLITPLILVWQKIPTHLLSARNALKTLSILFGTWLVGQIIFLDWFSDALGPVAKGYWLFIIITLTATYLGKHGTLLVLLMITMQAMLGTTHGIGFFGHNMGDAQLINFWFYIINLSVVGVSLTIHINERDTVEQALRESEKYFRRFVMQSPIAIAIITTSDEIELLNDRFSAVFGYTATDLPNLEAWWHQAYSDNNYRQDRKADWMKIVQQAIATGTDVNLVETRVTCKNGEQRDTVVYGAFVGERILVYLDDITERKQLENAQLFLSECGYRQSGEGFFTSLARYLAETLAMDYVCIARLNEDGLTAETMTIYTDGHFESNCCYSLHNTPYGYGSDGHIIDCFSENVRDLFPQDQLLQEMMAESYISITLWDFTGKPNGLIEFISRKPLKNRPLAEALLKLVAIRAAGEIERQRLETELQIAATIFESQEGMFITDANRIILKVNQAFTEITGYTATEAVGQTPSILRSGQHNHAFYQELWRSIQDTNTWKGEIWNRRKNGECYPQWLTITAVKTGNDMDARVTTHYVATLVDISEHKVAEEKIKQLAYYDALTNLPNRRSLYERIKYSINLAHRDGKQMAVLMLDLDKFKPVNDNLGHKVGDQLLQQVAERIKERLRDVDMVARLGGDEFVILLDEISQNGDVARIAQDIIDTLTRPFLLQENNIQIGASIGISLYPQHGIIPETLIDNADTALYLAKKQGRGCFAYFSEQLTMIAHERMALENRLRQAVEQQELCIHYQPQIDIKTGRIIGAEALVRWQDPNVGLVFPDDFMPLAETSNLFLLIAEWVLNETCKQGQQWLNAGLPALNLSVNVSPQQFQRSNVNNLVAGVLEETGFPAAQLELEITEVGLMANQTQTPIILHNLHAQGVRLSIDNFGTGYSSFLTLKHFPLTVLKIDKIFIDDIPLSASGMSIIKTIIDLAHNLDFKVLAKGVETPEQLAFLQQQGCDSYQGYVYSPALPAESFVELLHQNLPKDILK